MKLFSVQESDSSQVETVLQPTIVSLKNGCPQNLWVFQPWRFRLQGPFQLSSSTCGPGSVVEDALCKCILKPLRDTVYAQLLDFHTEDGSLNRLRENQLTLSQQSLEELGVAAGVPDGPCLERIQAKLSLLHQAYSPKKKETQMLKVCKMLYEAMNLHCEKPFGADDFLPVLIYMLVRCDVVSLDVEYMMELMDPNQLQGEGGYYLTTWFGALYHIENFRAAFTITRQISVEAQHSIHQWHRRRTIHHHHRRNLQVSKTISVPPNMTTALVCAACAEKYGVSDSAAYGLFLVSDSSTQLLAEDSCPQKVRADLLQREGSANFIYKPKNSTLYFQSGPFDMQLYSVPHPVDLETVSGGDTSTFHFP
uniref:Uncharacterized protein n=1 Tax=Laticauda laticaudata TaxID=8630 RepID=A0A8C5S2A0_LATLA